MNVCRGFSQILRQAHAALADNLGQLMQMRFKPFNRLGYINHWIPPIYSKSSRMRLLAVQKDENRQKKGSTIFHARALNVIHLQSALKKFLRFDDLIKIATGNKIISWIAT